MSKTLGFILTLALAFPAAALAESHEIRLPLRDGQISTTQFLQQLGTKARLAAPVLEAMGYSASLDFPGVNGCLVVRGLNLALGEGFHLSASDDALILQIDPDKLPGDCRQTAAAVREFTEVTTPDATARENRHFGLMLPASIDPAKPLAIVIHGLDGDDSSCRDLRDCLQSDGRQAAMFIYPAERPMADNVAFFAKNMQSMREKFPGMKINLIAESMGGLIARQYVEGSDYPGGVDHFILVAPPNNGSDWTACAPIGKIRHNFEYWRNHDDWSFSWLITEGLDESIGDLKPGSKYLNELNALPRRAGVKYTIIAGDQPITYRLAADCFQKSAAVIAGPVKNWWGFRQTQEALQNEATSLEKNTASSDGPVRVDQAKLSGVTDFVVLPVDHLALFHSIDGKPPAAWAIIRDRLAQ